MKLAPHLLHPARLRRGATSLAAVAVLLSTGLVLPVVGAQAATPVSLGTAEDFAVLAGSTITNTGSSTVTGDVGLDPGTAVAGFGPGADQVTLNGSMHVDDGVALQAKADLGTAYTSAAGQTPVTEIPTELGGSTLKSGVYSSSAGTFGVTGTVTLDAEGDPDAVFIFQMASTLITAAASQVTLINGADLCNVYWQVGSSATLGTDSGMVGTIMALTSITLDRGATVQGRVLARNGAVTMDTNTITSAACATPAADEDDTPVEDDTPTDDTPVDEAPGDDTPVGDDADTGGDTPTEGGTPSDGTPSDGTPTEGDTPTGDGTTSGGTTSQIERVPGGGVDAGDGGLSPTTSPLGSLFAAAALLLMVAGTVGVVARRRITA